MRVAAFPFHEELRLQDLKKYNILDSAAESEFDDLLELAAQICGCPIAAITFIDKERQWFKSRKNIISHEMPRSIAFCAHTILEQELLIVPDALHDERFYDNPLVTGELFIRFYAGAPIVSIEGSKLGAICVIDQRPKELTTEQSKALRTISRQISKLLELRLKNQSLRHQAAELLKIEKQHLYKTLQEHELERQTLGTHLHEQIAQDLAAVKFHLEIAATSPAQKDLFIKKSKEHITRMIHQIKELSLSLVPTTLHDADLHGMLLGYFRRIESQFALQIQFNVTGEKEISYNSALTLFRIVEEQFDNIIQHSQASQISVQLVLDDFIGLSIKDNGVGLNPNEFKKGTGIAKILSKAEALGGSVDITGMKNKGCHLLVKLPNMSSQKNHKAQPSPSDLSVA